MTRLMAPILSFTAEQLSDCYQTGKTESIHLQNFRKVESVFKAEKEKRELQWGILRNVRSAVLKALETLRQMVATNVGVTLIPAIAKNPNDNIAYIPFEKEKPIRKIALFWRKTSGRKKLFEKIAELSKL